MADPFISLEVETFDRRGCVPGYMNNKWGGICMIIPGCFNIGLYSFMLK
jgi:hypothetical protein